MKHPNAYPTPPGNYRSFWTTDGLVICRECNQVGHFARPCPGNLPPPRAPTHYQNHWHNYVPPTTTQYSRPSYPSNRSYNQYSQCPSYRSHTSRYDTMGYPCLRNATYTNPSRRPPFSSADQTDNKYQAKKFNIPGQSNNYSNVIQNHALKDRQCLVSGTLDHKPIMILIDTDSSISLSWMKNYIARCPIATTYTVLSSKGRWQASYCIGYNLAVHCYLWWHISGATCCYEKYPFPCSIGNRLPANTWWNYQFSN